MSAELAGIISKALSEGFQVDPGAFELLSTISEEVDLELVINNVIRRKDGGNDRTIRRADIESLLPVGIRTEVEDVAVPPSTDSSDIEVLSDPSAQIAPAEAELGFKRLFQDRYWRLIAIARKRPDSKNLSTVDSVKGTRVNEAKVAGLLSGRKSRYGGLEVVIDDPTGSVRIQVGEPLADSVLKMPLDSLVLADVSTSRNGQLYARQVSVPDIPRRKPVTASHTAYAVLLSDLHIGSRMFLEHDFARFISWLSGRLGDAEIVNRVRYVIIAGDVVDGIGVYPGQEHQLIEIDVKKQFRLASELIGRIPRHLRILVSPGNHDPVRQALPQPAIPMDIAEPLYNLENVKYVGNPASVRLDGVNFLVYHGRSLDDIIATVPELAYSRPATAMQVLLKSRHLAPIYGKRTALSPEVRDMLVIDPVPDVFHAGHVHAIDVLEYRGTLMVNSGTFQAQTPFQANMGLEPTSSIVPIVDLSTLKVTKRSFAQKGFVLNS